MLRLEGEVFRFGTAMAEHSLNQQIHPSGGKTTGRPAGKTGRGAKPEPVGGCKSVFSRKKQVLSAVRSWLFWPGDLQLGQHRKRVVRALGFVLRRLEGDPRGPGIGVEHQAQLLKDGGSKIEDRARDRLRRVFVIAWGDFDVACGAAVGLGG